MVEASQTPIESIFTSHRLLVSAGPRCAACVAEVPDADQRSRAGEQPPCRRRPWHRAACRNSLLSVVFWGFLNEYTEYTLNLSTSDLASVGFHKRRPHMDVHNPQDRDQASCAINKRLNELNCKVFFFFLKKHLPSIPSYRPSARLGEKKRKEMHLAQSHAL